MRDTNKNHFSWNHLNDQNRLNSCDLCSCWNISFSPNTQVINGTICLTQPKCGNSNRDTIYLFRQKSTRPTMNIMTKWLLRAYSWDHWNDKNFLNFPTIKIKSNISYFWLVIYSITLAYSIERRKKTHCFSVVFHFLSIFGSYFNMCPFSQDILHVIIFNCSQ